MLQTSTALSPLLHRTSRTVLNIAVVFWGTCLALVAVEATFGSSALVAGMFFLSIPLLVGCLTWVSLGFAIRQRTRNLTSVVMLGVGILASASVIILVGLVAAANLKSLLLSA